MYAPSPTEQVTSLKLSDLDWARGVTRLQERPFWDEVDGTVIHSPGLYRHETVGARYPKRISSRVCDPVRLDFRVLDEATGRIGVALVFECVQQDRNASVTVWMDELVKNARTCLSALASAGAWISLKASHIQSLAGWVMEESQVLDRNICVYHQTGWCGSSFRLPHIAVQDECSQGLMPAPEIRNVGFGISGTLSDWRDSVGSAARGNPLIIFALGVSLSGSAIVPAGAESGGFHFFGQSGRGKSTLLDAAVSIWGGVNFKKSWSATANGKRALYAALSGTCAVLDELHESSDPRAIQREIYALNGVPKTRARPSGGTSTDEAYLLSILSSGESSIPDFLSAHGLPPLMTGAANRLIDLQVTSRAHGVFDDTHGMSPRDFSDHIKQTANRYFGAAGVEFVNRLVVAVASDSEFVSSALRVVSLKCGFDQWPEHARVSRRFALAALAVEFAIEWGILPVQAGDGVAAARLFFNQWLASRAPDLTPCDLVWSYLSTRGALVSNPDDILSRHTTFPIYRKWVGGVAHWLLTPDVLGAALGGRFSKTEAIKQMMGAGWMVGNGKSSMCHIKVLGHPIRVYEISIPADYKPPESEDDQEPCIWERPLPMFTPPSSPNRSNPVWLQNFVLTQRAIRAQAKSWGDDASIHAPSLSPLEPFRFPKNTGGIVS